MVDQGFRPAGSDRDGGGGLEVLEQEPLVMVGGSSSGSRSNFFSGGLESTINRLSKWLASGVFGFVILCRHDAEALWAIMGSALNAVLSLTLKRLLNQERPAANLRSDPGMPSSHAQFLFFVVVLVILTMIEELGLNALTLTLSGLTCGVAAYLAWLRVSQQFHTVTQVVVGASLGLGFALAWFWSWNAIVSRAFDSHFWVKVFVLLGAGACSLGFLVYIVWTQITEER